MQTRHDSYAGQGAVAYIKDESVGQVTH